MKGDFTRTTFQPAKRYSSVRMQQGRVQLDADWNEQVDIEERLREISLRDVIGPCGTPKDEHGGGFRIEVTDGGANLAISGGRTYVDGILCEIVPPEGETSVALTEQIDLPAIDLPPPGSEGQYFVYVDVWQRHITALEDPEIREVALGGPDTATRTQTICQVKLCEVEGDDLDCASLPEGWIECTAAPTGQLRARTRPVDTDPDPCVVPAAAGYTRLENQLYRIEVHQGGELGGPGPQPTFKWSRDNGSIVSDWLATDGQDVSVRSLGRDRLLTLEGARWVELADDVNELLGEPGLLVEVIGTGENTLTVTPAPPVPDLSRRPKVRRWDTDTATGAIPIAQAPDDDSWIRLEGGIEVDFTPGTYRTGDYWLIPARAFIGEFAGDIEWPTDGGGQPLLQSPDGIEHHYCKLALVEVEGGLFVDPPTDCRDPFCPLTELEPGCCTVVVRPGDDVQTALDSLPAAGGCVCLKAGLHVVSATVVIARSDVTLHGESQGAVLRFLGADAVLAIRGPSFAQPAERVRVNGIRFEGGEISTFAGGIVTVEDVLHLRIEDCEFRSVDQEQENAFVGLRIVASQQVAVMGCSIFGAQIGLWATVRSADVSVTDCRIDLGAGGERSDGIVGIFVDNADGPFLIADCEIAGGLFGVVIDDAPVGAPSSLARASIIRANRVLCVQPEGAEPDASSALVGIDVAAEDCLIEGNEVRYPGPGNIGIRVSGSGARVLDNRCVATNPEGGAAPALGLMIGVDPERAERLIASVEARGNTFSGAQSGVMVVQASDIAVVANDLQLSAAQAAIFGVLALDSRAVGVLDNLVRGALAIGAASTGNLRVEGNTATGGTLGVFISIGESPTIVRNRVEGASIFGIALTQIIARADVVGNRVIGCGFGSPSGIGIGASGVLGELNLESNEVMNTGNGPDNQRSGRALGLFGDLILEARVVGNLVTYSDGEARDPGNEDRALLMRGFLEQTLAFGAIAITIGFPIQILGNKFIGTGFTALVELLQTQINDNIAIRFERVTFNDNYCAHFSPPELDDSRATVSLEGRRGIVMGNHVKATTPDYFSVNFNFMPSTYVGNVVEGPAIQGTPIPTPASDYNLST